MNRLAGLLLAALALMLPAKGFGQSLIGVYETKGNDEPAGRPEAVILKVEGPLNAVRVTRIASVGNGTWLWTSEDVQIQGRTMKVRYQVNGNEIEATYALDSSGGEIEEKAQNLTKQAPHDDWVSIATIGRRLLKPGAAVTFLPDFEAFEKSAHRGSVPGAQDIRELKFLMTGMDTPAPILYLMNTRKYEDHYMFYTDGLDGKMSFDLFVGVTYFLDARQNLAGSVLYHESYAWPDGQKGLFALEAWPSDTVKAVHMAKAYHALQAAMPSLAPRLAYHPTGETQEGLYSREKDRYAAENVRVVTTAELFGNMTYSALNVGAGFGLLRVIDGSESRPPSARDVVIFKRIPNDLSHISGIITEEPQTPLSHVNLKAMQNKTPNAYVKSASRDPRIAPLVGQIVRWEVKADDFAIRAATKEEAEQFLEDLRPKKTSLPPRDLSEQRIRNLADLSYRDADTVGAKAANVAELRKILPPNMVPDGFAIPFWFYDRFMSANGLYEAVKAMMADPAFKSDPAAREQKLADFRKRIKQAPVPADVSAKLADLQASLPRYQGIRFRSSSNSEDLPGFSGAGLYDSFTHRPDEGPIEKTVKQVWASLWNFRAFEEREFYRIDHFTAAMGVLVHRNFDDESANGVAITRNVFSPIWPGFYINAQIGESLITNPDGSTPDEFLVSRIGENYDEEVQYVQRSNRTPAGRTVLSGRQIGQLVTALDEIQQHFKDVYKKQNDPRFAMDVEWKFDQDGKLVIKQARPVVD